MKPTYCAGHNLLRLEVCRAESSKILPDICEVLVKPGQRGPAVLEEERAAILQQPLLTSLVFYLEIL